MLKPHGPVDHGRRTFLKTAALAATGVGPLVVTDRTIAQTRTIYVNTWGGSWTAAEEAAFFKPFTEQTGHPRAHGGAGVLRQAQGAGDKRQLRVGRHRHHPGRPAPRRARGLRGAHRLVDREEGQALSRRRATPTASPTARSAPTSPIARTSSRAAARDRGRTSGTSRSSRATARCSTTRCARCSSRSWPTAWPPDKVFPMDVDRAFRKLDQIKPHIKVWWTQGNQSQQLLRDGEVDMMVMWNARASELKQQGLPVELVWNGATITTTMWGVAKGAPNRKLAWEFLQFAVQAEAAGGLRQPPLLRPHQPRGLQAHRRRGGAAAADLRRERRRSRSGPTRSGRRSTPPGSRSASRSGWRPDAATAARLPRRGRHDAAVAWLLLAPACLALILLFVVPIGYVLLLSVTDPAVSLGHYRRIFTVPLYTRVIVNTFATSLDGDRRSASLLGYPVAYVMARRTGWLATLLLTVVAMSFWTGFLVRTYAWLVILGSKGPVRGRLQAARPRPAAEAPLHHVRLDASGMTHILLPYMILALFAVMKKIDPDHLRAAASLGARPRVGLPGGVPAPQPARGRQRLPPGVRHRASGSSSPPCSSARRGT